MARRKKATSTDIKYGVFILTHGRPDNVVTASSLRNCGYTGDIYSVIDDEDETGDRYRENYGDKVIVFSKEETAKTFDAGNNFNDRKAVVYARNALPDIAARLGFQYYLMLDDDYTTFSYRFDDQAYYRPRYTRRLDNIFQSIFKFYQAIPALSIAIGQGGDYMGGERAKRLSVIGTRRKAMNTFFCSTARRIEFNGSSNEDVTAYVSYSRRGELFLTLLQMSTQQALTQQNEGGMTDIYLEGGTYIKSFYSVMYAPSCVKVSTMGRRFRRLHHKVTWNHCASKIIRESHMK